MDITWWHDYLKHFNGIEVRIQHSDVHSVLTDACIVAVGAFYNGDFAYMSVGRRTIPMSVASQ